MSDIQVTYVDVYVLRGTGDALEALVLRRAASGRCPGSWESVHGGIEPGENPTDAALRELGEETGLVPARFYNLSRVESFYRHREDLVALIPVFVALVAADAQVRTSDEHDAFEWLAPEPARARMAWPRERRALEDAVALLSGGDAGPVEDVLRIC
ncbi:MAG: NUDIX domain-containing protein [Gemmatimonadales bacterium]